MTEGTHRQSIRELRARLLACEQRLRDAEAAAPAEYAGERPPELTAGMRCARELLMVCERENYLSASERDLVQTTLSKFERRIVELSPSGRPTLHAVGGNVDG